MVGLAVAAEATSNALRAYDLGSHLERLTITAFDLKISLAGGVLVLAAIAVSLSQTRAAWVALTPGDTRQRIVAGIGAALLLSISITAMATHILAAQRAKSGDETQSRNGYVDAKKAYDDANAELDKVRDAGTAADAAAALANAQASVDANIWRRTAGCTDATTRASIEECRKYTAAKPAIEAAAAKAKRKADVEAKLPGLKLDLDRQHLTDAATSSESDASWAWAWIMGLGVVMIATFGPAIFASVECADAASSNGASAAPTATAPEETFAAVKAAALANAGAVSPMAAWFSGELPEPPSPRPGKRQRRPAQLPANVVDFRKHPVVAALEAAGGSVASNRELAQLMQVTDGEASKRCQEIENRLDVVRDGKRLRIALKA